MKKIFLFVGINLLSFSAIADLVKSVDAGVITIQGSIHNNRIFIEKYKDSGICYTTGKLNNKNFSVLTYKEAGELYIKGEVPEIIESTLNIYNLSAYRCANLGLFN